MTQQRTTTRQSRKLFEDLEKVVVACRKCRRLVQWREKVAGEKVARFSEWTYWGKPVPGFGDPAARLLIVGLAPAAHGGNRTGRMFTGDRSGDWLFGTLFKFGFSDRGESISREDGLQLTDCYITASARCAPPKNKLLPEELKNCRPFLHREVMSLNNVRVVIALGRLAFDTVIDVWRELGLTAINRRPPFAHGMELPLNETQILIASFHPSQQNTFTGKLTEPMFHAVFRRARTLLKSSGPRREEASTHNTVTS